MANPFFILPVKITFGEREKEKNGFSLSFPLNQW